MQPVELPSVAGLFFRIFASLSLIIILTYVVLNIVKKQQNLRQQQKEWVRIYDYQALGPNRGLYLLELYGSIIIAGVSEGQIAILKEINPDDEEWQEMKERLGNPPGVMPSNWRKILQDGWGRFQTDGKNAGSFEKQLEEQLKNQMQKVTGLYRKVVREEQKGEVDKKGE